MCTEAVARRTIGVEGAQVLIDVVTGGWDRYLAEGIVRPSRTRANVIFDHMQDVAAQEFAPLMGVRSVDLHGSVAYSLHEIILLRFKKHSRSLLTSNIPTGAQVRLSRNGFFDGMPSLSHVSCGYVLDRAEAGIEKVVVVRRIGPTVDWWIDLEELASGVIEPVTAIFGDLERADLESLPTIRRLPKTGGDHA